MKPTNWVITNPEYELDDYWRNREPGVWTHPRNLNAAICPLCTEDFEIDYKNVKENDYQPEYASDDNFESENDRLYYTDEKEAKFTADFPFFRGARISIKHIDYSNAIFDERQNLIAAPVLVSGEKKLSLINQYEYYP